MYSAVKQPTKQIYVFFDKKWKIENFSSSSTGREKLIDLSNKITRWIIERYYWFKCAVSF